MPMWCMAPLEMNEGNSLGQGYNRPTGCSAVKAPHATFNFFFDIDIWTNSFKVLPSNGEITHSES